MGLGSHFLAGPVSPVLHFEFCLNEFKQHNWVGSIVKVNLLLKKKFHNFFDVHLRTPN